MDLFTPEFKRLKAKNPPPSFDDVIDLRDFDKLKQSTNSEASKSAYDSVYKLCIERPYEKQIVGLKSCADWNVFKFDQYPGFTVILNPFVDGYQRYWVSRCLRDFPSDRKNVTNLSALGDLNSFGLWSNFARLKKPCLAKDDPLRKLRWTTLGYHYDWTSKEYSDDRKAKFPPDIQCLTQHFSHCLDFGPYKAEAAIVNYYHLDSTLAGHTDHSEVDQAAPLFSISFGQTAIFMLGGLTKAEKPISIFLRSGDICVMSGPCRLAYHAVPRILSPQTGRVDLSCFNLSEHLLGKAVDSQGETRSTIGSRSGVDQTSEHIPDCPGGNSDRDKNGEANPHVCLVSNSVSSDYGKDVRSQVSTGADSTSYHKHDTFNDHLTFMDSLNKNMKNSLLNMDWNPFDVYLQSSRINVNVRQVFPLGCDSFQLNTDTVNSSKKTKLEHQSDLVSSTSSTS